MAIYPEKIAESLVIHGEEGHQKEMTQLWGKLFGINFALGVATGLIMEKNINNNFILGQQYEL